MRPNRKVYIVTFYYYLMQIECVKLNQNENILYLGKTKMSNILYKTKVDVWKIDNQEGYQREVTESRAKAFGRYISKTQGISPNTILINIRATEGIDFDGKYLNIPDGTVLWVVDGQHRLRGLENAIESGFDNIKDFEVPIVVTLLDSRYEEAKQFAIVNRTQKGIRADLAERFLQKAVRTEGKLSIHNQAESGVISELLRGYEWKPKALEITDLLNSSSVSIWRNMIRLPNEPKGATTVSQKTFMDSLEPILKDNFFSSKNVNTLVQILNNYWNSINETWPEPFEDSNYYVLPKLTGVMAMHKLFLSVTSYCTDKEGKKDLSQGSLMRILDNLRKGNIDSSFWASDGEGGRYGTNKKGIKLLVEELEEKLTNRLSAENGDLIL